MKTVIEKTSYKNKVKSLLDDAYRNSSPYNIHPAILESKVAEEMLEYVMQNYANDPDVNKKVLTCEHKMLLTACIKELCDENR